MTLQMESKVLEGVAGGISADEAAPPVRGGDVLACGFAITVGAWIVAYISRFPMIQAPGEVTVSLMLGVIFAGGLLTARYSGKGWLGAVLAGALSGLLNNLIVGSLVKDLAGNTGAPSMALWFGGSIACNAAVAGLGGAIGRFFPSARRDEIRWTQVFAIVLAAATLPLISIGGLVTAFRAGLAVPDWPQSFGYNMFLFPLSQMQANHGKFYEHAHRLMGSLVGFTALGLAIYSTIAERRGWIKVAAWAIGFAILIQAVIGGTRVTEKSIDLAIAHGVFAQVVFAAMACLAAATGRAFATLKPVRTAAAATDRALTGLLVASLIVQLVLGAFLRHKDMLVLLHITTAAFVATLVLACGIRAWGIYGQLRPMRRTGLWLMALVGLQLTLGVIALVLRAPAGETPTTQGAVLTTAHQANGALLLAVAGVLATWTRRLVVPAPAE